MCVWGVSGSVSRDRESAGWLAAARSGLVHACTDLYCRTQSYGPVVSAALNDDSRAVSITVLKRDALCISLHFHSVRQSCY